MMGKRQLSEDKALSVKDIAARAGVSVATVSRVINQKANVSSKTQARVREAIALNNYVPNMIARSLKTNKTPLIGIIVPDISGEFYNTMVQKLQTRLLEKQFLTFILNTKKSADIEKEYQEWQSLLQVSGWLVLDCAVDFGADRDAPIVYINWPGAPTDERTVSISSDAPLGGHLAGRELIQSGCKSIAVITSSNKLEKRVGGFLSAIREHNDPDIAVLLRHVKIEDVNSAEGYRQMTGIMEVFPGVDGVFCIADRFVPGVLKALEEAGRRVPEDVKVVGHDDTPIASWLSGGFTTVRQDMNRMSDLAIDALMRLLNGETVKERKVILPETLVRRRTTKAGS